MLLLFQGAHGRVGCQHGPAVGREVSAVRALFVGAVDTSKQAAAPVTNAWSRRDASGNHMSDIGGSPVGRCVVFQ